MIFPKPKIHQSDFQSLLPSLKTRLPTMSDVFINFQPNVSFGADYCLSPTTQAQESVNSMSMNLNIQNTCSIIKAKENMFTATLDSPCVTKEPEDKFFTPKFIPFRTFEMENMREHLLKKHEKNDLLKMNGTIKSNKGRKKTNVCQYNNMADLITSYVMPKWKKYLAYKCQKTSKVKKEKFRSDTIWKKIIRDVREFYRILFRMRFHYLDYKDVKGATKCVEILFEELGIPIEDQYKADTALFTFLHQTHKVTGVRLFRNSDDSTESSPFEAIDSFNSLTKKMFMSDKLAARLFYFVFANFMEEYTGFINLKYQERIASSICLVIRCYKRMDCYDQLPRVHFLLT